MRWGVVWTIRWSTPTGLTSDDDDDDEGCFWVWALLAGYDNNCNDWKCFSGKAG